MKKCYVCDTLLTEKNKTQEHIIINAGGGRLKSKNLICINCNSAFGEKIDKELAVQLNYFANMLMIERERGGYQTIIGETKDGTKIKINGSKPMMNAPKVDVAREGENVMMDIRVRDEKELNQILKGMKKKYPQVDIDEVKAKAIHGQSYMKDAVRFNLEIGGEDTFRAVCKCAVNYFIFNEGEAKYIKHLIPYIKQLEVVDCVWFHYQDLMYDLIEDSCFHLLHLVADPIEKTVICYVDYFNVFKYIVLLNKNYEGEYLEKTYCFDVLTREERKINIKKKYDRSQILNFFKFKDDNPYFKLKEAMSHTVGIAMKRQETVAINEITEDVMNEVLSKYSHEKVWTKEMINALSKRMAEEIVKYKYRNLSK